MRGYGLVGAAALLLGGCGPEGTAGDSGGNAAAAAPASRPAAPAAQPRQAEAGTIPAAFLGVYDGSLEACARPSVERLTVSPRELRFHESIGAVRRVTAREPGAVEVEADYQGEGESWRSVRELSLSDGGARLTVSGDGTRLDRRRCPAGAR